MPRVLPHLTRLIVLMLCLASFTLLADDTDPAGLAAADAWLAQMDADDYPGSWEAAGRLFREQVTAAQWAGAMRQVRDRVGAVTARNLVRRMHETDLPGAPPGEYLLLDYRSTFEKPGAVDAEQVVCMKEEDGVWRVVGYFLR